MAPGKTPREIQSNGKKKTKTQSPVGTIGFSKSGFSCRKPLESLRQVHQSPCQTIAVIFSGHSITAVRTLGVGMMVVQFHLARQYEVFS